MSNEKKQDAKTPINTIKLKSGVEIPMKVINLDLRCEINDKMANISQDNPQFTIMVDLIKMTCVYSDEQINELSIDEIVDCGVKIFEVVNRKKLKQ